MDDDTAWTEILVDGWGPLVRSAVADRVEEDFAAERGTLAAAVLDPDDAPAEAVEAVHGRIVAAIGVETGADLDELGSQAAWATYEDTWAELARRLRSLPGMRPLTDAQLEPVRRILASLPADAALAAGAAAGTREPARRGDDRRPAVDVPGLYRWLATEEGAGEADRDRVRALLGIVVG